MCPGSSRWSPASPQAATNAVYVSTNFLSTKNQQNITCLGGSNGKVCNDPSDVLPWQAPYDDGAMPFVFYDFALNAADGKPLWSRKTDATLGQAVDAAKKAQLKRWPSTFLPALDGKVVYAGASYGYCTCDFGVHGDLPVASCKPGTGLVCSQSVGQLEALDVATGKSIWKTEKLGGRIVCDPVFNGDASAIIVNTQGGGLQAIDPANGNVLWQVKGEWGCPILSADKKSARVGRALLRWAVSPHSTGWRSSAATYLCVGPIA